MYAEPHRLMEPYRENEPLWDMTVEGVIGDEAEP
jgi:hypothetical protein